MSVSLPSETACDGDRKSADLLAVLTKARDLISAPESWTKGQYARDASGEAVVPTSPAAVCFCSWGALDRAVGGMFTPKATEAVRLIIVGLEREDDYGALSRFNDALGTSHADVLEAFDNAITLAALSQGSVAAGPKSHTEEVNT